MTSSCDSIYCKTFELSDNLQFVKLIDHLIADFTSYRYGEV